MIRVQLDRVDDNPHQSRLNYGDLTDLKASFTGMMATLPETSGLLQVPLARLVLDGRVVDPLPRDVTAFLAETPARVELAYGHRRKRAFQQLALSAGDANDFKTFPVNLAVLDDETMASIAWEENEKRQDISDIERAVAIEKALHTFGWTQAEVGQRWGLSQSAVANLLRLLRLPDKVRGMIRDGEITGRHGRALLPLVDIEARLEVYLTVLRGDGSESPPVTVVERAVAGYLEQNTYSLADAPWADEWAPEGLSETERACAGCPRRVRVGRDERCTNLVCYHAKQKAYKHQVRGPGMAARVYNEQQARGWEAVASPSGWAQCSGCHRTPRDFTTQTGEWLQAGTVYICPECAARAQLHPCSAKSVSPAPEVYHPTPSDPKSLRRDEAAEYFPAGPPPAYAETVERGDPATGFTSGEDEEGDGFGAGYVAQAQAEAAAARPTLPAPQAKVVYTSASLPAPTLTKPAPVVVLTARIMPPSNGDGFDARRVLVSIGNEGAGPAVLRSGAFGDIGVLIGEALHAHFPEMQSEE